MDSKKIDIGARVGIMRNLEFTAGGRAHRIITGSFSSARPAYDPKTGILHISTTSDPGEEPTGRGAPNTGRPAMTSRVEGAGADRDASTGDTSPDRRRDKDTT